MKMFPGLLTVLILWLASSPAVSRAGDYQGAEAVLRQGAVLLYQNACGTDRPPGTL